MTVLPAGVTTLLATSATEGAALKTDTLGIALVNTILKELILTRRDNTLYQTATHTSLLVERSRSRE